MQRQEDHYKFEARLGCTVRCCLKKQTQTTNERRIFKEYLGALKTGLDPDGQKAMEKGFRSTRNCAGESLGGATKPVVLPPQMHQGWLERRTW